MSLPVTDLSPDGPFGQVSTGQHRTMNPMVNAGAIAATTPAPDPHVAPPGA